MIKKVIIGTGIVLVLMVLFVGRGLVSYVRTSAGYVSEAVKNSVPMEFQIERARDMIEGLDPEIRKNLYEIAREQVTVERLAKNIAAAEAKLAKAEEAIKRLRDDLKTGEEAFEYGGRKYTAVQVKTDLANRFQRYQTAKATLHMQRQVLDARQRSLEAARQRLDGTLAEKQNLQVKVENLEARLKMIAAAETTSDCQFDDSRLAHAKQFIDDLGSRIDVEEKLVNANGYFQGQIPVDEPEQVDVVEKVTQYFEGKPAVQELAVQD
jgi:chromosome segregation ATPase